MALWMSRKWEYPPEKGKVTLQHKPLFIHLHARMPHWHASWHRSCPPRCPLSPPRCLYSHQWSCSAHADHEPVLSFDSSRCGWIISIPTHWLEGDAHTHGWWGMCVCVCLSLEVSVCVRFCCTLLFSLCHYLARGRWFVFTVPCLPGGFSV